MNSRIIGNTTQQPTDSATQSRAGPIGFGGPTAEKSLHAPCQEDIESTRDNALIADPFLTEVELAKRWTISVKVLQKWRLEGKGPDFNKFGGSVRYSRSAILDYENSTLRQTLR